MSTDNEDDDNPFIFQTEAPADRPQLTVIEGGAQPYPISAARLARNVTPIEWVVVGVLPTGSQTLVAGPPKRGRKTWMMLYLAYCVSRGVPWLGFETRKRPVYYVALEDGPKRMARRLEMLGMQYVDLDSMDASMFQLDFGLEGYSRAMDVAASNDQLIIVDPLIEIISSRGINENDPAQVCNFFRAQRELAQKSGAAICVPHHMRKASFSQNSRDVAKVSPDAIRGSGALQGVADGWMLCSPAAKGDAIEVTFEHRDTPIFERTVTMRQEGSVYVFDYETEVAAAQRKPRTRTPEQDVESDMIRVRRVLYSMEADGWPAPLANAFQLVNVGATRGTRINEERFQRVIAALVEMAIVRFDGSNIEALKSGLELLGT